MGREDCRCGFIEVPEDHKVGYNYNMFERLHQENHQCGKAIRLLCRKANPMKYGTNGVATLTKHVQSFGHIQRKVEKLTNYKIPGSGAAKNIEENY